MEVSAVKVRIPTRLRQYYAKQHLLLSKYSLTYLSKRAPRLRRGAPELGSESLGTDSSRSSFSLLRDLVGLSPLGGSLGYFEASTSIYTSFSLKGSFLSRCGLPFLGPWDRGNVAKGMPSFGMVLHPLGWSRPGFHTSNRATRSMALKGHR